MREIKSAAEICKSSGYETEYEYAYACGTLRSMLECIITWMYDYEDPKMIRNMIESVVSNVVVK